MAETKLVAELRTEFGKGYARRARVAGLIPAVVYGHGAEPTHVNLPARELTLAVRVSNALLNLDLDGKSHLVMVKDIQRNAVAQTIEHVDLLTVKKGEKVSVEVSVHLNGETAPGTVVNQEATTVTIEAEATHLPSALQFDLNGRAAGEHVHASDLVLPKGVTLVTEADTLIVNVSEEEELQIEADDAAAEAPAADAGE